MTGCSGESLLLVTNTMSEYQREPNENWLQAHQGETVVLRFPFGEYAVTVHSDDEMEVMMEDANTEVTPADD